MNEEELKKRTKHFALLLPQNRQKEEVIFRLPIFDSALGKQIENRQW